MMYFLPSLFWLGGCKGELVNGKLTHGMRQHWQSSPHQHGSLTGGLAPLIGEDVDEVAEVVEGGIFGVGVLC